MHACASLHGGRERQGRGSHPAAEPEFVGEVDVGEKPGRDGLQRLDLRLHLDAQQLFELLKRGRRE